MKKRVLSVLVLAALLGLWGCGYREGVVQPSPKSFVWFSGNTAGAVAYIGDIQPFALKGPGESDQPASDRRSPGGATLHQIQPGKYNIVVKKGDRVVVNRTVILGEGMTTEIEVP
jgi:hypothetical protein